MSVVEFVEIHLVFIESCVDLEFPISCVGCLFVRFTDVVRQIRSLNLLSLTSLVCGNVNCCVVFGSPFEVFCPSCARGHVSNGFVSSRSRFDVV